MFYNFKKIYLLLKIINIENYSTYGASCNDIQKCNLNKYLSCLTYPSECRCPDQLDAGKCDCPTTHYWNSNTCVPRVSESQSCSNDYMCNLNKIHF